MLDMNTATTLPFADTVRARRSVRAFLPDPLPDAVIAEILEEANLSPSNCNTQPWNVHVVSGASRDALSEALLQAVGKSAFSKDFSFAVTDYTGRCSERQQAQGKAHHEALSVGRDDAERRMAAAMGNYRFFGAPHVVLLFMPSVGDNVRAAADVGMYAQTFLLALAARGLGGVPQTSLGMFADTIRDALGIAAELKLLFGISFGRADPAAPANRLAMPRDPLSAGVTFHR
jgi:nitroreductase